MSKIYLKDFDEKTRLKFVRYTAEYHIYECSYSVHIFLREEIKEWCENNLDYTPTLFYTCDDFEIILGKKPVFESIHIQFKNEMDVNHFLLST